MKSFTRTLTGLALLLAAGLAFSQSTKTQYYVVAHEDDWQLFMSGAWDDITTAQPVCIIYTTAGDAGYGGGANGAQNQAPFYQARELAAAASLNVATSVEPVWYDAIDTTGWVKVNGHNILHNVHDNVESWFMRLPDGNMDGSGFSISGNASLRRLRLNQVKNVRTVDGSATYTNWTDVMNTMKGIMARYSAGVVNGIELDPTINPNANSDHLETTWLAMKAMGTNAAGYRFWNDYSSTGQPMKSADFFQNKSMMLGAMAGILSECRWPYYVDSVHRDFCYNEITRTEPNTFHWNAYPGP